MKILEVVTDPSAIAKLLDGGRAPPRLWPALVDVYRRD